MNERIESSEESRAAELLARYPYVPGLDVLKLVGIGKLQAIPDHEMRALLAGVWVRNFARWGHEEAGAEARERETYFDPPTIGVPPEGAARDRWDRLNTQLLLEWLTLSGRIREKESEHLRNGVGPFREGHEADLRHNFRARMRERYGQSDVDPVWSTWDRIRMEEARQKGRTGRSAWPGGDK